MAEKKSILLRISPELWDHLSRWARDDLRSLNAQIEFLLRDAVRKRTGKSLPIADTATELPPPGDNPLATNPPDQDPP